jgi:DNA polymerase III subunit delta
MIVKYFDLKKNLKKEINFYLLYGLNTGLIEETIDNTFKSNFSKNIFYYEETEVLSNVNKFKEEIYNKSFFENDKLIIINRASDKILKLVEEIIEEKTTDIKIIIKSGILEKRSKIRTFFEKNRSTIVVPFYEDNYQSLMMIAQNFFKAKAIKISHQNINYIIERSKGNRIFLKNELKKIESFCIKKKSIELDEILKLTNLAENYNISDLADQCLAKNKKKTIHILNENNTSSDENILILKTFLHKLKRLKKLKIDLEFNKDYDFVISSFKPPIFWKDKDLVKLQLKKWSLPQLKFMIKKINDTELLIKKNSQIAVQIVNDFILERLEISNN